MRPALAIGVLLALLAGAPVPAQSLSSGTDRMAIFRAQTEMLDSRAGRYKSGKIRQKPPQSPSQVAPNQVRYTGKYRGPYLEMARAAARRNGVPEGIFLKLVQRESGWNAAARSSKGALGLAQLMPATARDLNVKPTDPYQNLDGGARYLAQQYRRFGTWPLALAAYNAGPGAVLKYGGVPPYKETRAYVTAILGRL